MKVAAGFLRRTICALALKRRVLFSEEDAFVHSQLADRCDETVVVDLSDGIVVMKDQRHVPATHLWNMACVLRQKPAARSQFGSCVVGDARVIQRVWCAYGVRPNVLFVPDTAPIPSWCHQEQLPSIVIRCSPMEIKRGLLSADHSDGFGAEFPIPVSPSLLELVDVETDTLVPKKCVPRALVVHGVRNPGNLGALLRSASSMGFRVVILESCSDAFNEKVIRSSNGEVFNPKMQIFELNEQRTPSIDSSTFLQQMASVHRLLPIFAVPSQDVEHVGSFAERYYYSKYRAKGESAFEGVMLVVTSDARGLNEMRGSWRIPMKSVTLQLDHPYVSSLNISVSGTILMQYFRPAAQKDYARRFDRGVVPPDDAPLSLLDVGTDEEETEDEEEEDARGSGYLADDPKDSCANGEQDAYEEQ